MTFHVEAFFQNLATDEATVHGDISYSGASTEVRIMLKRIHNLMLAIPRLQADCLFSV